jgi:type I restriction enzyme S subunit
MSSWKECTLAEITSILGDGLHGTPNYDKNGEYFFINGNNLSNGKIIIKSDTKRADLSEYEKYKKNLNDRTILVSINGTLGNIALYNNEKCILGKSACYFNVNDNVDKYFIKYVVTNKDFQEYIRNFATGTTIPNVSLKTMREYSFSLPPLEEQKAIAEVLSSLDDKIDLLHRQNQTLESLAQTLFRQWFIEEAKEEWEEKTLGELLIITSSKRIFYSEYLHSGVPFYRSKEII